MNSTPPSGSGEDDDAGGDDDLGPGNPPGDEADPED